jgi:hypothetical protein
MRRSIVASADCGSVAGVEQAMSPRSLAGAWAFGAVRLMGWAFRWVDVSSRLAIFFLVQGKEMGRFLGRPFAACREEIRADACARC